MTENLGPQAHLESDKFKKATLIDKSICLNNLANRTMPHDPYDDDLEPQDYLLGLNFIELLLKNRS